MLFTAYLFLENKQKNKQTNTQIINRIDLLITINNNKRFSN